jgi:hypothetical protein
VHEQPADAVGHLLPVQVVDISDDYVRTFLGEAQHRRQTDARASAGDDGHLAVEPSCHLCSFRGLVARPLSAR